jgi:predicted TIM-barrel enzyme
MVVLVVLVVADKATLQLIVAVQAQQIKVMQVATVPLLDQGLLVGAVGQVLLVQMELRVQVAVKAVTVLQPVSVVHQ